MKVIRPNEIRCALTIVPQLNREDRFNGVKIS